MTIEGRVISVGFDKPVAMEGSTIYVTRKPKSEDVEVESKESFGYRNFSRITMPRMEVASVTNLVGDLNGWFHVSYEAVLGALQEENPGSRVVERH